MLITPQEKLFYRSTPFHPGSKQPSVTFAQSEGYVLGCLTLSYLQPLLSYTDRVGTLPVLLGWTDKGCLGYLDAVSLWPAFNVPNEANNIRQTTPPTMVPSMFKHQHIFLEERAESTRRLNLLKRFSACSVPLTFPFPTFWVSKINPEIYIKWLLKRKLHRVINYTRDLAKLLFRGQAFEPCYFAQFAFRISNAIVMEAKIDVDDDCDDYDD